MAPRIEYFFDYASPYSYLADTQLPALARRTGAEVVYRPMALGGVFKATGNSMPAAVPAKGSYLLRDLERWGERYGVPIVVHPHVFPVNSIRAMRVALVAAERGAFERYHPAAFAAYWAEDRDIGDARVLGELLERLGLDAGQLMARAGEQEIKDRLRANTDEAIERGVFGAPTFFVGEEMFWGNDRLDFVESALARAGGAGAR